MRAGGRDGLLLAALLAVAQPQWTAAADVLASPPGERSVTVYRAPFGSASALNLDQLGGFALVSETRTLTLPAGESRVRFEGVADGIEPASAIITGLPAGLLEKNRDAKVLSPAALVAASVGKEVELVRTYPRSNRQTRTRGRLRSDADGGVVFESAQGLEALRCSGLPETFSFSAATDLPATPTLSALIRTPKPIAAQVTLAYLSHGFDWMANYVVTLALDARTLDLGGWVTLANSNAVGFPSAHTQIVAGRLNRESGEVEPIESGTEILAQCWPRGSTSDVEQDTQEVIVSAQRNDRMFKMALAAAPSALATRAMAQEVQQEQLGDLKLYRVPQPTTIASRQIKQVRLLDRTAVPVELIYQADLPANQTIPSAPARRVLRTRNDAAHHLGLPLPSGRIASFLSDTRATVQLGEMTLRDVAENEEFEITLGPSPDVQVSAVHEQTKVGVATTQPLPPLPDIVRLRSSVVDAISHVEISNATPSPVHFELTLRLADGTQVVGADHHPGTRNGRPLFALTIAPNSRTTVRYQTEHTALRPTLR